ncbi:MAG: acyl-CoA dehydrogenase [bacterium]|nr:acyl-CoA dehydrogenase [bacterium]
MASKLIEKRDVEFVLYEQLDILGLTQKEKFEYFSRDEFDMVLEQALKFAENEMAPTYEEGDRIGAKWEDGKVTLPESFHKPLKLYGEGGWIAACEDPEIGGQGLPISVFTACNEMFHAGNTALNLYPGLAHGTLTMVIEHGTEEQKKKYLEKLMAYEWAATMALTEPGAGSDLARVAAKAVKIDDTHYKISGQKIFITGGDLDTHPNVVHPVLARIEGDPDGVKGISIFLVPKYRVSEDGTPGEWNDVSCPGIEHKMGLKGSATCQLSFGDNGDCIGEILGEPRQGLAIMFLIMNEERLNVGVQSLGLSSTAYLHALEYAKEREQGTDIRKKGSSPEAVTILHHPDVRRNLLQIKAYVEGLRALNYYTGYSIDLRNSETDPEKRKEIDGIVEFLTPICKAYTSAKGFNLCSDAVNVFGGYGFCQDYPVEQFTRDQKITAIYEGTNAIHSIDLLGRKMGLNKGGIFKKIMDTIQETIDTASANPSLKKYAENVGAARENLMDAAEHLRTIMSNGEIPRAFQDSLPYLEIVGDTILGWMHLWQLSIAAGKLDELFASKGAASDEEKKALINDNKDAAYYSGKVHSARYFISKILPLTEGKIKAVKDEDCSCLDIEDAAFGAL